MANIISGIHSLITGVFSDFCRVFLLYLQREKSLLRNRIRFITPKNTVRMTSVRTGFTGASVARSIRGKPKTMAGKF